MAGLAIDKASFRAPSPSPFDVLGGWLADLGVTAPEPAKRLLRLAAVGLRCSSDGCMSVVVVVVVAAVVEVGEARLSSCLLICSVASVMASAHGVGNCLNGRQLLRNVKACFETHFTETAAASVRLLAALRSRKVRMDPRPLAGLGETVDGR